LIIAQQYRSLSLHRSLLLGQDRSHQFQKNSLKAVLQSQLLMINNLFRASASGTQPSTQAAEQGFGPELLTIVQIYIENYATTLTFCAEILPPLEFYKEQSLLDYLYDGLVSFNKTIKVAEAYN